jgi:hypothetical protein
MNLKQKTSLWRILFGLLLLTAPEIAQAQFSYTTNADGISITITGYSGPGGAVTIPTNINGLTVSSIGTNAFYDDTELTSVIIPESVTNSARALAEPPLGMSATRASLTTREGACAPRKSSASVILPPIPACPKIRSEISPVFIFLTPSF